VVEAGLVVVVVPESLLHAATTSATATTSVVTRLAFMTALSLESKKGIPADPTTANPIAHIGKNRSEQKPKLGWFRP
jgi:hypothetical protein